MALILRFVVLVACNDRPHLCTCRSVGMPLTGAGGRSPQVATEREKRLDGRRGVNAAGTTAGALALDVGEHDKRSTSMTQQSGRSGYKPDQRNGVSEQAIDKNA